MTTCTACHKPLSGGIDTFGSNDMPMCWECHSSAMFDGDPPTLIDANIFAADAEPQPVRVFVTESQQQEAAGQLKLL